MAKKFFIVTDVDSANSHLPTPLSIGEVVMEVKDEELKEKYNGAYIRVKHNLGKATSSFSRFRFKRYIPKGKDELKSLIKNKGFMPEIQKFK